MGMMSEAFGVTSEEDAWGRFAANLPGNKSGEEVVFPPEDDWAVNPPRDVSQKTSIGKFGPTGTELSLPSEVPAEVYVCTFADAEGSLTWAVSVSEMEGSRATLDVSPTMSAVLVKKGKVPFEIRKRGLASAVRTVVMLPAGKWRAGEDGEVSPVIEGSIFYLALAVLKTRLSGN